MMAARWEKCLECGTPLPEAPAGRWRCPDCGTEYGQMELIALWASRDLRAEWAAREPQKRFEFA